MNLKIKIKDKEYDVVIEEGDSDVTIKINNKEYTFDLNEPQSEPDAIIREVSERFNVSDKEIKSPLSGIVSDIFVVEGEEIKSGKKLLSLSAMKMENEILAEADGKIKQILFKKDDKVKEGEILIIFY
jgi:biotin carboxyl carrier protein